MEHECLTTSQPMYLRENVPINNDYSTGPSSVTCFDFDLKENDIINPNRNFIISFDFISCK